MNELDKKIEILKSIYAIKPKKTIKELKKMNYCFVKNKTLEENSSKNYDTSIDNVIGLLNMFLLIEGMLLLGYFNIIDGFVSFEMYFMVATIFLLNIYICFRTKNIIYMLISYIFMYMYIPLCNIDKSVNYLFVSIGIIISLVSIILTYIYQKKNYNRKYIITIIFILYILSVLFIQLSF